MISHKDFLEFNGYILLVLYFVLSLKVVLATGALVLAVVNAIGLFVSVLVILNTIKVSLVSYFKSKTEVKKD